MKVLITGSSGYCGQVIATHLVGRGVPVVGLDVEPPPSGAPRSGFTFERVDVRRRWRVERVVAAHEPTHVIHLAFRIEPSHDPETDRILNVEGSRNVGETCFEAPTISELVNGSTLIWSVRARIFSLKIVRRTLRTVFASALSKPSV